MKRDKKRLEIPRELTFDEIVNLSKGIDKIKLGSENMYFEYINKLGHMEKGFYKF